MTIITDQPGRLFVISILTPLTLIFCYFIYNGKINYKNISIILIIFIIIFFFYELFWLVNYPAKKIDI